MTTFQIENLKEKSSECSKVLQLMDDDYSYLDALSWVLSQHPKIDKQALETELANYI